ncbi:polyadenylate-binding protein RBP47-like [Mangifera indica]|uniref:polyadenylate-binding protein RBP47-like n=1 Tax=Mangifera indica TaxID=29780 RepID=UPI001CFA19DD|nr:polyadenylate-binding protein RBP47-like [Mangifera indica]
MSKANGGGGDVISASGTTATTAAAATAGGGAAAGAPTVGPAQQQQQPQSYQWIPQHHHQHPQQWMGMSMMQYPAAAMAMMQQHMMMYPQHYMAAYGGGHQYYQQQQHHHQNGKHNNNNSNNNNNNNNHKQNGSINGNSTNDETKTIWVGDLFHWMDETYLHTCFSHTGQVSNVKVIRNKHTGLSEGYGFVEFFTRAAAENVLQSYNGSVMPNTEQLFRLNWATFAGDRRVDSGSDLSIFVGDLAPDVTDAMLQETFSSKYSSVKGAKVIFDSNTGRSKGYGFVRFGDENERSRAMTEMNGVYCSSRPMRIDFATPKKASAYQQQYSSQALVLAGGHASNGNRVHGSQSDGESNNATIFVGALDSDVSDEGLREAFSQFGEIVSVKIPVGKGCGFVQFANRKDAEDALQKLQGMVIGKQAVRLSWGRNPGNKQWRSDSHSHWNNGAHYGGHYYSGSGYALPPNQDQNMYAAATVVPSAS